MATVDRVRTMVEPIVAAHDATLYDVTLAGGKLVVAVTRSGGIDLETLTKITRALNAELDEHDPIGGSYTLEVTSPGLERPLRTAEHFAGAIGESITVRTHPDVDGERRVRGTLKAADDTTFTVVVEEKVGDLAVGDERTIAYDQVERARTTFLWGPDAKPGQKKSTGTKAGQPSGAAKQPQKKAPST